MKFQTHAWNGIRLEAPAAWQLVGIGHRHLAWEYDGRPAMELRWDRVRGRFSFEGTLGRLGRSLPDRNSAGVAPWQVPRNLADHLTHHQIRGFGWRSSRWAGQGLVLYCGVCRTAALCQLLHAPDHPPPGHPVWDGILSAFQDHWADSHRPWQIYDIQVRLPESYRLNTFSFQAGRFHLAFSGDSQTLQLYRWGPAAVLLADGGLTEFARRQGLVADPANRLRVGADGQCLEWTRKPSPSAWPHLGGFGRRHEQGRVWHLPGRNRILGLVLNSKHPFAPAGFNTLAENYGLAPIPA